MQCGIVSIASCQFEMIFLWHDLIWKLLRSFPFNSVLHKQNCIFQLIQLNKWVNWFFFLKNGIDQLFSINQPVFFKGACRWSQMWLPLVGGLYGGHSTVYPAVSFCIFFRAPDTVLDTEVRMCTVELGLSSWSLWEDKLPNDDIQDRRGKTGCL